MKEPQAFYHVAGMGHWKEIVTEQLCLLAQAGFSGVVNIGFLGAEHEDGFIAHVAKAAGVRANIRWFGPDFGQFEFPTQRWMHEACSQLDPETPVLYFHGKGASNTLWQSTMWRWLMNAYCLTKWREMVRSLGVHNCAGISWMPFCYPASAFPGTFWWTTAGFVAHLTPVDDYIEQFMACISHHNPLGFGYRHAAETWVNSRVDANPCIFGPPESRLWDHGWWTAPENRVWHESAILLGSPVGRFTRSREPENFLEAFIPFSHADCTFGSDKITVHDYAGMYDAELSRFRGTPARFLEIGVNSGWGLAGWRQFLGSEAIVVGVDIDTSAVVFDDEKIHCCDATDEESLKVLDRYGLWDVIVDDGSHRLEDQVRSFELLWSKVASGGVYVIEDIIDLDAFTKQFGDATIYDTRGTRGRRDDVCAVFRKP